MANYQEIREVPVNEGMKSCKRGVRHIPFKSQFLISSGLPAIDHLTGGGVPLGSIFLLEEPKMSFYSDMVLKRFLGEGVLHGHSIFISSLDLDPHLLVASLPAITQSESSNPDENLKSDEEMDIAWRYHSNPKIASSLPTGIKIRKPEYAFDISKVLPEEHFAEADFTFWPNLDSVMNYDDLLVSINDFLKRKSNSEINAIRIVIQSLGSALWSSSEDDVPKFLYQLRLIVQKSNSVAIVTVPSHLFKMYNLTRCEHISDMVISMESLDESSYLFNQYKGLITLKKVPTVNSLSSNMVDNCDLAFNIHKKQFIVEVLHLPPDLETTTQREQDDF